MPGHEFFVAAGWCLQGVLLMTSGQGNHDLEGVRRLYGLAGTSSNMLLLQIKKHLAPPNAVFRHLYHAQ